MYISLCRSFHSTTLRVECSCCRQVFLNVIWYIYVWPDLFRWGWWGQGWGTGRPEQALHHLIPSFLICSNISALHNCTLFGTWQKLWGWYTTLKHTPLHTHSHIPLTRGWVGANSSITAILKHILLHLLLFITLPVFFIIENFTAPFYCHSTYSTEFYYFTSILIHTSTTVSVLVCKYSIKMTGGSLSTS